MEGYEGFERTTKEMIGNERKWKKMKGNGRTQKEMKGNEMKEVGRKKVNERK